MCYVPLLRHQRRNWKYKRRQEPASSASAATAAKQTRNMKGSICQETMCSANKHGWTKRWTAATACQNLWSTRPILGKGWDTEENTNRWKDAWCSQTGRINTANMITPPKATYRINAIPIKISVALFTELEQVILKFMWKHKGLWKAKISLRKENRAGGITLPDLKLYCKAIVTKTGWYRHKHRHIDQRTRTKGPKMNPYLHNQLIYKKEARIYNGEKTASSINGVAKTGHLYAKDRNWAIS